MAQEGYGKPLGDTVRTAYVILTHRDWQQVQRLVRAIRASSPDAFVLIAHDSRRAQFPLAVDDPRVEVLDHGLATDWGSWELVEATLLAFDHVRQRANPDLVCLISGHDYPVRRLAEWEDVALTAESWIGSAQPLRYIPHWGRRRGEGADELTRYTHRWFQTPMARRRVRIPGRFGRLLRRVRGAVALRVEPLLSVRFVSRGRGVFWGIRRVRLPFSPDRPCYSGSQWIALRRQELNWLLDEDLAPGSPLRRLYRHAIIPDESALVTALAWRAPPSRLPPVTQVTWDPVLDQPTICSLDDLGHLVGSGSPFCRKVDPEISSALMDELDRIIAVDTST
jgi:hypothetical protein